MAFLIDSLSHIHFIRYSVVVFFVLPTKLPTDNHHNSKECGVCGRSGKYFPVGSHPRH